MIRLLCMLAGGTLAHLRGVWIDQLGNEHAEIVVHALITRKLAQKYDAHGVRRIRLADPRGRWFAATALARAADLLIEAQGRCDDVRYERSTRFVAPVE
jgi:hypothetical protein